MGFKKMTLRHENLMDLGSSWSEKQVYHNSCKFVLFSNFSGKNVLFVTARASESLQFS